MQARDVIELDLDPDLDPACVLGALTVVRLLSPRECNRHAQFD
jgi:hypothetical protein